MHQAHRPYTCRIPPGIRTADADRRRDGAPPCAAVLAYQYLFRRVRGGSFANGTIPVDRDLMVRGERRGARVHFCSRARHRPALAHGGPGRPEGHRDGHQAGVPADRSPANAPASASQSGSEADSAGSNRHYSESTQLGGTRDDRHAGASHGYALPDRPHSGPPRRAQAKSTVTAARRDQSRDRSRHQHLPRLLSYRLGGCWE